MSLNPKVMLAPSPQVVFRDKDTGLPLRNGYVEFYKDNDRSTPNKPIYKLAGTAPSYSFVELPNPVPLTSIGTLSDGLGNDIIPYYYPFQGTIFQDSSIVELYYLRVYDENGVFQFDRQAWPNISTTVESVSQIENFIPDGQFLIHNNIPASVNPFYQEGQIRQADTILTQGGWHFVRPSATSALDFVKFFRFASAVSTPTATPRYAVDVNTTVAAAGDAFKYLLIKWPDVNKFASDDQFYTFGIYGQTISASSLVVSLYYVKNYGSGGQPQEEVKIADLTVTDSYSLIQASFTFGSNASKIIGPNDDDYIGLQIRFPTDIEFHVRFTDAILTPGQIILSEFPVTTNSNFLYDSVAGWMPTPDHNGGDLYLPLRLTPTGLEFDRSEIGNVLWRTDDTLPVGYLTADGSTYPSDGYSVDGIPYSRLHSVWYNPSSLLPPRYGTGKDYFTAYPDHVSTFTLHNNSPGNPTAPNDGAIATGFTFSSVGIGAAPPAYKLNLYWQNSFFLIETLTPVDVYSIPVSGSSGIGINVLRYSTVNGGTSSWVKALSGGASFLAGTYFLIPVKNPTNVNYKVWFKVNGSGTEPVVAGTTPILVNLETADTSSDIGRKISHVLNGFLTTNITTVVASSIPAGAYWNATAIKPDTTLVKYAIWYSVDGIGSAPVIANTTTIQVDLLSSDTSLIVRDKTIKAINSQNFSVPNLTGYFIRGHDASGTFDPDPRFSAVDGYGNSTQVGTYEFDDNLSHIHVVDNNIHGPPPSNFQINQAGGPMYAASFQHTDPDGADQGRPRNIALKAVIKY